MNESLIRQDRLGRMRFTREQRESLLDAYEASGLTGPQFAALHGVAYQTFATWAQKRRKQSSSQAFHRKRSTGHLLHLRERSCISGCYAAALSSGMAGNTDALTNY